MHKKMILALVALIVVSLLFVVLRSYPAMKQLERRPRAGSASISRVYEVPEAAAAEVLRRLFTENRGALNDKFSRFLIVGTEDQLFPDEVQLKSHPSTESYASIEMQSRQTDFYLYEPTGDHYWHSEFYYKGEPARFRCGFIIHLEPVGPERTHIAIFEYQPVVWVGKRFDIWGHNGPGFYNDIRQVEPTVSDRAELLEIIDREQQSAGRVR
jgi:hypothetical protein